MKVSEYFLVLAKAKTENSVRTSFLPGQQKRKLMKRARTATIPILSAIRVNRDYELTGGMQQGKFVDFIEN